MGAEISLGKLLNLAFGWDDDPEPEASVKDRVLDALDDAPVGHLQMSDGSPGYHGPLATVQWLAASISMSDSAIRSAVHDLRKSGLVKVWSGREPQSSHRRLFVSAVSV